MNLKDVNQAFDKANSKASEVNRQIVFSGFAVIWILKTGEKIPDSLQTALLLLVISLVADLLQYIFSSLALEIVYRRKEKELDYNQKKDFRLPIWVHWPVNLFFWAKIITNGVAFLIIGIHVANQAA